MSKDRDGYMKTSGIPKGQHRFPGSVDEKVDADKNSTYVIESMDEFIKSKKDEDIVIHCKGIQLYPKKLNSLSHSFEDLVSNMKSQLSEDEYGLLENKIKTLQSLIDDLKESCSVSLFLY